MGNAVPGSIIYQDITETRKDEVNQFVTSEFFMISQAAKVGVPVPTRYTLMNTLGDNSGADKKTVEDLRLLTYKLCYLYYNVSGSIKVPAPVQYANMLQKQIQMAGKNLPKQELNKRSGVYYI